VGLELILVILYLSHVTLTQKGSSSHAQPTAFLGESNVTEVQGHQNRPTPTSSQPPSLILSIAALCQRRPSDEVHMSSLVASSVINTNSVKNKRLDIQNTISASEWIEWV
jgi:hypothetical protein